MPRRGDAENDADGRPPICPACGVTMGIELTDEKVRFVCLECGFSDSESATD
jgi:predicted RNA-binding Zn-ribbon protein involved in translation (DUF1610 family)